VESDVLSDSQPTSSSSSRGNSDAENESFLEPVACVVTKIEAEVSSFVSYLLKFVYICHSLFH
jgi:hypothetical protein